MSHVLVPRRQLLYGAAGFWLLRKAAGPILAQAGRRIDAPNASIARFPAANIELVRGRIRKYFEAAKPDFLVSSAACGTDLLCLEVAGELKINRVVLLPTDPKIFRNSSVVDRPGNWGEMFDRLLK